MQNFILIAILLFILALFSGCETASSTPIAKAPRETAPSSNSSAETAEPASEAVEKSIGSLATPTDAYKTAYDLRKKKDIMGLKRVMSMDVLEFLTLMGEDEGKTLDDMLKEMVDKPQASTAEVRKEKIKGDRAELEYLTETGSWKTMDFEKVDGKWLMSFPKADKGSSEPEL